MLAALIALTPAFATQPVKGDADDPAIWVNRRNPSASRILGTDKKGGRLYVFDLNGKVVQILSGMNRPNNVDILSGFDKRFDLAMVTDRDGDKLHAFAIDRNGRVEKLKGKLPAPAPMGIALWRDSKGDTYAFVSPKKSEPKGYIQKYRITLVGGKVKANLEKGVGEFIGGKEIESLAVDRTARLLWYSDETFGNRAVRLDNDSQTNTRLNADFKGDHEGIAVWTRKGIIYRAFTDQLEKSSRYRVYANGRNLGEFTLGADSTDGIDVCAEPLGPRFSKGIFVAMNSKGKNFFVVGLDKIEKALK